MVECKIREDGVSRIPTTEEWYKQGHILGRDIRYILKEEYSELYACFEKYRGLDIVDSKEYGFLKEVLFENKVVGFAIYNRMSAVHNPDIGLTELDIMYILPDYRGKGVMYTEIEDTKSLRPNDSFAIHLPNYHIVNSLIKNGHTIRLNEDIIWLKDYPISVRAYDDDVVICNLYDLRINKGVNLTKPCFTPLLDRDMIDGFTSLYDEAKFLKRYGNNPLNYFKEIEQIVKDYNKN